MQRWLWLSHAPAPMQVGTTGWQFLPSSYFTTQGQPHHRQPPAHILQMFEVSQAYAGGAGVCTRVQACAAP